MGKFALMLKKEQEAEEKRKAQGVAYPSEQKVIASSQGAANAAPIITWKQDGAVKVKSTDSKIANQSKITQMEAVTTHPDFAEISVRGGMKWKQDKGKADSLLRDPGYRKYQEYVRKNNFAGTLEGVSGLQLMLGENNDRYMPQGVWSPKQNNVFRYYYQTNPENAKEYAAAINDEYKRSNEEKLADWAKKYQAAAMGGALVSNQIPLAEMGHNLLSYAPNGELPYTTQVTPSRYNDIVNEAIEEELRSYDRLSTEMYSAMMGATNEGVYDLIKLSGGTPLGVTWNAVNNFAESFNDSLYEAQGRLTNKEALKYAARKGGTDVIGDLVSRGIMKKGWQEKNTVSGDVIKNSVEFGISESIRAVADQISEQFFMREDSKYNNLVNELSRTMPLNKAKDEAWRILGTEMVEAVLEAMGGGLAYGLVKNSNRIFGK